MWWLFPPIGKLYRDDQEDLVYKTKREKYNAVIDEIVKLHNKRAGLYWWVPLRLKFPNC